MLILQIENQEKREEEIHLAELTATARNDEEVIAKLHKVTVLPECICILSQVPMGGSALGHMEVQAGGASMSTLLVHQKLHSLSFRVAAHLCAMQCGSNTCCMGCLSLIILMCTSDTDTCR